MRITSSLSALLVALAPIVAAAATPDLAPAADTNVMPHSMLTNTVRTSPLLAKGKRVSVSRDDLDEELVRIKTAYAAQGKPFQSDSPLVEREVLDSLITRDLLMTKITEADRTKGKDQFEQSLQRFKTNQHLSDDEFNQKLNQQIQVLGLTKRQWEHQGIEQAAMPIMLERELKVAVTDDQVRKFYDDNPGKFEQPEMVRAAHILLMTMDPATRKELSTDQKAAKKKQIDDILKRARAGEDFAKLAREYTEDPGSKEKGGEYTFPRGQMVPEFEAAAFSLNTNQISDVVTTAYGYHIIKLYEKFPAKKVDFQKVSPDIKQYLAQRDVQQQLPAYVEGLKKDSGVQILDEKLKAVELPPAGADADAAPPAPKK